MELLKRGLVYSIIVIMTMISFSGSAGGEAFKRVECAYVENNGHFVDPLIYHIPGETVRISVQVNHDTVGAYDDTPTVDVYILNAPEYHAAMGGEYYPDSFEPIVSIEHITKISFLWTIPDNETYYVVVDNRDNGLPTDSVPCGDLNIDYSRAREFNPTYDVKENSLTVCLTTGIVALITFIFLITGLISLFMRWRKQHPVEYSGESDDQSDHYGHRESYDLHEAEGYNYYEDWD